MYLLININNSYKQCKSNKTKFTFHISNSQNTNSMIGRNHYQ